MQLVLSALNTGVILGAAVIQLPQLYAVWAAKSARGVSEAAVAVGVISQSMYITYCLRQGLSGTSWAESGLVEIQLVMLLCMMWIYSSKPSRLISGAMTWIGLLTVMYRVPDRHLWLLGILPSQLGAAGRVPQLIVTYRLKSLGTLSVVPFIGAALGNLARIITTAAEVDDSVVLVGCRTHIHPGRTRDCIWFQHRPCSASGLLLCEVAQGQQRGLGDTRSVHPSLAVGCFAVANYLVRFGFDTKLRDEVSSNPLGSHT